MLNYKKEIETPRLEIYNDEYAESPRIGWANIGYFITVDRKQSSPDENELIENIVRETGEMAQKQENHIKLIEKEIEAKTTEKVIAIFPIVKYEHSQILYKLGTKNGFDYSNNGFYIITDKTAKVLETKKEDFEEMIRQEIKRYNQWINGEIYAFTLYDEKGEIIESCHGFYDIEDIREYLPKEFKNEDLQKYEKN